MENEEEENEENEDSMNYIQQQPDPYQYKYDPTSAYDPDWTEHAPVGKYVKKPQVRLFKDEGFYIS